MDIDKDATLLITVDLHQHSPEINLNSISWNYSLRREKSQGLQESKSKPDFTFNLKYDCKYTQD